MAPLSKSQRPKRTPRARNPEDPREKACRERCEAFKIPPDAIHEGKPMWARFLDEVEMELKSTGWQKSSRGSA